MKTIKIKICSDGVQNQFSFAFFFTNILKKYYDVQFSDEPDYVFFHESTAEQLNPKYDKCIKIFYTGENVHPNFNLSDYAVSFDYLDFGDRHYRLPLYLVAVFYTDAEMKKAGDLDFAKPVPFTKADLAKKTDFCSFVYRNYLAEDARKIMFDKLSAYKRVDAGGPYLNNVGGPVPDKYDFETKRKFAISFENSSRSGYTTEKLVNSLAAKTIPIYYGNPDIAKEFNEKRFINCHAYKDFDAVVARIKEIDQNDDLYLKMINEPVTVPSYDFKKVRADFEAFLRNIFDQPLASARRLRINPVRAKQMLENERLIARASARNARMKKILASLYRPFKKLGFLENLKQKYFRKKLLK